MTANVVRKNQENVAAVERYTELVVLIHHRRVPVSELLNFNEDIEVKQVYSDENIGCGKVSVEIVEQTEGAE